MIRFSAACVLLIGMTCVSEVRVGLSQAPTEPTLAETTKWLSDNLVGLSYAYERNVVEVDAKKNTPIEKTRHRYKTYSVITQAKFDGCVLTATEKSDLDAGIWQNTKLTTYRVPLDKMQSAEITVEDRSKVPGRAGESSVYSPVSSSFLNLSSDKEVVQYAFKDNDSSNQGFCRFFGLGSDDPIMLERVHKAFSRAITLCHTNAKPEPF